MKILIAPDKFKGSLSAQEAAERIAVGLGAGFDLRILPLADGGEGTAEAIRVALGGSRHELETADPLGRRVTASYVMVTCGGDRTAIVDMSEASGLWRVAGPERDPWRASTAGTGVLIRAAWERGADRVVLGLGGSATNDGGSGMARALGYVFEDEAGRELEAIPEELSRATRLRAPGEVLRPMIAACAQRPMIAACDVRNPLLGPEGATRVFGPQKGVGEGELDRHEDRLRHLADLVERDLGFRGRDLPGAGAAGGLGFGAMAFCGARLQSGFGLVSELIGLPAALAEVDAVITGEGSLDRQTLNGKGPHGVAVLARSMGKTVVALAGRVEPGCGVEREFDLARAIAPEGTPVEESIARAGEWLERAAGGVSEWLRKRIPV
ncbi:MAG: glycerate kinase [Verrucomicrobia bacterium]|nr:glycerate kinase [Verrucomicrobiota bacterium]